MKKTKVLIVDDSASIRAMLSEILGSDSEIEVVGTAHDPYDARNKIKELNPDVLTLDIEMPHMDGISFLEKIIHLRPMPVVMISTLTQKGADATIRALEIGAIDYVAKPANQNISLLDLKAEIIQKVKQASQAHVGNIITNRKKSDAINLNTNSAELKEKMLNSKKIIAIGASTGGVEAIREVLIKLPQEIPPIVITQHMPEKFTASFAKRLDSVADINVVEAQDNMRLKHGTAYIAPGSHHMMIRKRSSGYFIELSNGELVSGHRPSVDVMLNSVAEAVKQDAISIILTGMGKDGADGMLHCKNIGALTLAQDESTCVVYGMPKAAVLAKAVKKELPLEKIALEIVRNCY